MSYSAMLLCIGSQDHPCMQLTISAQTTINGQNHRNIQAGAKVSLLFDAMHKAYPAALLTESVMHMCILWFAACFVCRASGPSIQHNVMVQTLHAPIHTYDAMEMRTTAAPQTHHRSTEPDTQLMQDVAPDHKQECKKQN